MEILTSATVNVLKSVRRQSLEIYSDRFLRQRYTLINLLPKLSATAQIFQKSNRRLVVSASACRGAARRSRCAASFFRCKRQTRRNFRQFWREDRVLRIKMVLEETLRHHFQTLGVNVDDKECLAKCEYNYFIVD